MDGDGVSRGMADGEPLELSVVGDAVALRGMAVGDANEGGTVGVDVVGDVVASTGIAVRSNVADGKAEGLEVG